MSDIDRTLALLKARATQLGSDEPEESVTVKGSELLFLHDLITSLREALEPFASFAENTGDGWLSNIHRESISDWFGPSDFIRARKALDGKP